MANFHKIGDSFSTDVRTKIRRLSAHGENGIGGFGAALWHNNPTTLAWEKYQVPASTNLIPISAEFTYNGSFLADCEVGFHTDAAYTAGTPASGITNWIGDIENNAIGLQNKNGFQLHSAAGGSNSVPDVQPLNTWAKAPTAICANKYAFIYFYQGASFTDHYEIAITVLEEAA